MKQFRLGTVNRNVSMIANSLTLITCDLLCCDDCHDLIFVKVATKRSVRKSFEKCDGLVSVAIKNVRK